MSFGQVWHERVEPIRSVCRGAEVRVSTEADVEPEAGRFLSKRDFHRRGLRAIRAADRAFASCCVHERGASALDKAGNRLAVEPIDEGAASDDVLQLWHAKDVRLDRSKVVAEVALVLFAHEVSPRRACGVNVNIRINGGAVVNLRLANLQSD
jgi:hypothetical protein